MVLISRLHTMMKHTTRLTFASGAVLAALSLQGCTLWTTAEDNVPPPPAVSRQPRLLQVPDDLRLPRLAAPQPTPNLQASVAPMAPAAPAVGASAAPAAAVEPARAPVLAAPAPAVAPEPPKAALFAPYMPTSSESQAPKTWVVDPSHDFPWIAGAQPTRVNEETTVGTGSRMFGRLFARVEFGTGAIAPPVQPPVEVVAAAAKQHKSGNVLSRWFRPEPKQPDPVVVPVAAAPVELHAAGIRCAAATCLDVARDMLLKDAERKGWKVLLNRRVSLHQSFQFQRDDRVMWVEVNSSGKNHLDLEYALLPAQQ